VNSNTQQFISGALVESTKTTSRDKLSTVPNESSIKMSRSEENADYDPAKPSVLAGFVSRLSEMNSIFVERVEDSFLAGMALAFVVLAIAAFISLTVS
jgi:hypothetical protein